MQVAHRVTIRNMITVNESSLTPNSIGTEPIFAQTTESSADSAVVFARHAAASSPVPCPDQVKKTAPRYPRFFTYLSLFCFSNQKPIRR